jgi:hypothetical protein
MTEEELQAMESVAAMCLVAAHDDRMSTGKLYADAAQAITSLLAERDRLRGKLAKRGDVMRRMSDAKDATIAALRDRLGVSA